MTVSPPGAVPAATIARRVGAYAVDVGVAVLLAAILFGVVRGVGFGAAPLREPGAQVAVLLFAWCGILFVLAGWWLVYSGMQGGHGSIGQRALGLRLADAGSGDPIGFWRAAWRNVVFALAGSIVVGYFSALFDRAGRRQGWHDLAAGAVVVDVRATTSVPAPGGPAATGTLTSARTAVSPYVRPESPIDEMPWPFASPLTPAPAPVAALAPVARTDAFPGHTMTFPAATTTEPLATDGGAPPPALRAPLYAEAPVIAVLTWDDGSRMAVYGRTLYGRNPASEPGAVAIAVRDETLSLSKTHFEIGGEVGGAWVADRHSTNGTTLVRDGGRIPLLPGVRTSIRPSDTLELGDRRLTVAVRR